MPVHQVLRLSRGAIIELDASEQDEVKVLANNTPVASGVVVVKGNRIAVEVKKMLPRSPDRGGFSRMSLAEDRFNLSRDMRHSAVSPPFTKLSRSLNFWILPDR